MSTADGPADDAHAVWLRREAFLDRFEQAWRQEGDPRIEDFLPPPGSPDLPELLRELIEIDLEYRTRRGENPSSKDYLARFPELAGGTLPTHPMPPTAGGPAPRRLGRYELGEVLGEGGFATVYRAWDPELRRDVAVKVPRASLAADSEGRSRTLREAQAAARLRHPAIVTLHEAGQDGDITYLVYDFISGPTLARLLKETRPAPAQAAAWVARLAEALDYAHRQGIVHRDVKPANVMMDRDGQPLLADFGLARSAEATTLTQDGDIMGTPAYMSPEQASGSSREADARSDVYSLGVVLYELLCGQVPFTGTGVEVLYRVVHADPAPPRRHRSGVPLDLETICLKAMAKEPARRYQTAGEMADDLRRYLGHQSIRARRRGPLGQLALWCRRRPALAATLAGATLVIVMVAAVAFWSVLQERDLAQQERDRAQRLAASLALDRGLSLCEQGEAGHGLLWLGRSLQLAPAGDEELQYAIRANLEAWRHEVNWPLAVLRHQGPVQAVAFSPDGKRVLTASDDNTARLWEAATGQQLGAPLQHDSQVLAIAFSPDGRKVATGSTDARLWDAATGKALGGSLRHEGPVIAVAFSRDGSLLATGSEDGTARLFDTASGQQIGEPLRPGDRVGSVAFSPDDKVLLTGCLDNKARLWDLSKRQAPPLELDLPDRGRAATFSPDGRTIVATTWGPARLWKWDAARVRWEQVADLPSSQAAVFSPTDPTVLVDGDYTPRLWNTQTGTPAGPPLRHHGLVPGLAFSPDGRILLTGSNDRTARLWDAATGQPIGAPLRHPDPVLCVAFSSDGRTIATGSKDGTARLWDVSGPRQAGPVIDLAPAVFAAAFSPDSRMVAIGGGDFRKSGSAQRWDVLARAQLDPPLEHQGGSFRSLAVSPDGQTILTGSSDGIVQLWEAATGSPKGQPLRFEGTPLLGVVAFSPDGKTFLTGVENDKPARLWDTATVQETGLLQGHDESVRSAVFSRDGRTILTGSYDKTARLWDAATLEPIGIPLKHQGQVGGVDLSPNGRLVLVGGDDGVAQLWDLTAGQPSGPPLRHEGTVRAVAFHPDGRLLLTGSWDRTARLWARGTNKPVGPALRHDERIETAVFSPDGRTVLTGGWDGKARFWRVPVPVEGPPERIVLWTEVLTNMALDDAGAIRLLDASSWEERRQRLAALSGPPLP